MRVATKLVLAFGLQVLLLGAVLTYHVHSIQEAVSTGYELTAIASRTSRSATDQMARLARLQENAAKFAVTKDRGYLEKLQQAFTEYEAELRRLQATPLGDEERVSVDNLVAQSRAVPPLIRRMEALAERPSFYIAPDPVARLQEELETLEEQQRQVSQASQARLGERLFQSSRAARQAERVSLVAAAVALLLSLVVSTLIVRSISESLSGLKQGAREVARGRFGYRLEADGGDEFSELARDFNSMTERLGELDRMKRAFLSKVSHDLKTPLVSMQETTALLLEDGAGPLTGRQRRLLVLHDEGCRRLAGMLAKLLDLSRLEAGGPRLELQPLDVSAVARQAVAQFGAASISQGEQILLDLPDRPLLIEGDPEALRQVLDNLLENAVKFSPRGCEIRVELYERRPPPGENSDGPTEAADEVAPRGEEGTAVVMRVSDHGPGVPDDGKLRVLEPFYQTEAGRSVPRRGVGLGLAICREIAVAHGGGIRLLDNRGGGTIAEVWIPAAAGGEPNRDTKVDRSELEAAPWARSCA